MAVDVCYGRKNFSRLRLILGSRFPVVGTMPNVLWRFSSELIRNRLSRWGATYEEPINRLYRS